MTLEEEEGEEEDEVEEGVDCGLCGRPEVCFALRSLFCHTNTTAHGSVAAGLVAPQRQQTADSWRTERVHLIS